MVTNTNEIIDKELDLSVLGIIFEFKPIIVGGMAMEYYGLRKKGDDIDFIVSNEDYQTLAKKFPQQRKDMWADLGVKVNNYEMFRSMWKFDYNFFAVNAVEYKEYKIVSFENLFLMKVLAMNSEEKHKRDVDLILEHYEKNQNPEYKKNMNDNINRYLSVPGGVIYNDEY